MTINDLQKLINQFAQEKNLNTNIQIRMLDLISEFGELAKELLKENNYGTKEFIPNEEWVNEFGDVLFSLFCMANETNIDIEKTLKDTVIKYQNRYNQKGHIGSNN